MSFSEFDVTHRTRKGNCAGDGIAGDNQWADKMHGVMVTQASCRCEHHDVLESRVIKMTSR